MAGCTAGRRYKHDREDVEKRFISLDVLVNRACKVDALLLATQHALSRVLLCLYRRSRSSHSDSLLLGQARFSGRSFVSTGNSGKTGSRSVVSFVAPSCDKGPSGSACKSRYALLLTCPTFTSELEGCVFAGEAV